MPYLKTICSLPEAHVIVLTLETGVDNPGEVCQMSNAKYELGIHKQEMDHRGICGRFDMRNVRDYNCISLCKVNCKLIVINLTRVQHWALCQPCCQYHTWCITIAQLYVWQHRLPILLCVAVWLRLGAKWRSVVSQTDRQEDSSKAL